MKRNLLFGFILLIFYSCQKDLNTSERTLSPAEKTSRTKIISEDQLLINMCNSVIASNIIIENATKNGLKLENFEKIDSKSIKNDNDLLNAFIELKIDGAEQLLKLKKEQESNQRELVKKYPELKQFTIDEWKSINDLAFKKIYESQGKTYYTRPD